MNDVPIDDVPVNPSVSDRAVSVYGQDDALEEFPVLKAFQQYIDSEQEKSRKRMVTLCVFFGILMSVVVAVFVLMLFNISSRNQALNDRLVEYAMRERTAAPSAAPQSVVVQPPQDSAAILALTSKLEEIQKTQKESEKKVAEAVAAAKKAEAEKAEALAKVEAAKPKAPTPAEIELKKVKALLAAEKEKTAVEREKQRQADLEEYRRRRWPELYEKTKAKPVRKQAEPDLDEAEAELEKTADMKDIDDLLEGLKPVSYFDDKEETPARKTAEPPSRPAPKDKKSESPKPAEVKQAARPPQPVQPPPPPQAAPEKKDDFTIPVDVKGSSSKWQIPND